MYHKKTFYKMIRFILVSTVLVCFTFIETLAQYDPQYVETKKLEFSGETYAIQKIMRKNNKVKVKYFASKNYDGTAVYQRYTSWAANKNIVSVSSGTYMTNCNASYALPVGLCIDNGTIVNEQLSDNLDGLVIVYATGGAVATNLKNGDLSITYSDGTKKIVDIRNSAFQRAEFIKWAKDQEATVFQTHLFVYTNQMKIDQYTSSTTIAPRRFLAVCKEGNNVLHYIINLPQATTLYNGSVKAFNYLKKHEDVDEITFLINLDTGCQNIFQVSDKNGNEVTDMNFKGDTPVSNAANLLVYYYE